MAFSDHGKTSMPSTKNREPKQPDTAGEQRSEDKAIFVPLEEIWCIERVIDTLETTRRELQKVAEGMKPIEN